MHRSIPNLFPVELCTLFFIFISLLSSQFRYPIHTIMQTFVYSTHRVLFIEEAEFSFIGLPEDTRSYDNVSDRTDGLIRKYVFSVPE